MRKSCTYTLQNRFHNNNNNNNNNKNYVHNLESVSGIAITFSLTLMKVDLTLEDIH